MWKTRFIQEICLVETSSEKGGVLLLQKVIFNIGLRLRSPEIIKKYKFLKESEKWDLNTLENYQLEQLKKIVNIAYNKSEFYKKKFMEVGVTPNDIVTLEDIKKLPMIEKNELLKMSKFIQNDEGYRKLFYSETSGSTGEPLVFYRNSEWDAGHRAAQFRGYSWYGVNPWERNGYFWGYSFDSKRKAKTIILDRLVNRFRLFSYTESDIKDFCNKLKKADYLEGYSSMIYEVAKVINKYSLGPFNLKMVKGTSEKIFDSYQEESIKAFGKKIVSEYGAAETGIIAYECKYGNMHITMENVIVEEIDGEAIVTNLISESFPIIRYKLGDSISLDETTKCKCGMNHKIIKEVLGRVGKVIYGKENMYPSLTLYYIFKNLVLNHDLVLNYQATQHVPGELIIDIEQKLTPEEKNKIDYECRIYFSSDVAVTINESNFKRDFEGKQKDFISYID